MKIDFETIIKLKSNKKLKKFNIKKPLFLNNYLFHYLILVNNLEALKLTTFSIYIENTDNLNGFQLAAKEDKYEILCYLIEEYSDYIYNVNSKEETFINYLQMKTLIKLMKKYKEIFVKRFQAELSEYPELNAEQIALIIDKVERDYVKNTEIDYLDAIWYAQKKVFKRVVAGILVSTIGLVVYLYLFRK